MSHQGQAGAKGASAGVAGAQEPKAFGQSGTSRPGPNERGRATATGTGGGMAGAITRPKVRRRNGGFTENMQTAHGEGAGGTAAAAKTGRAQTKGVGGYDGGRTNNWSPTGKITGQQHQQGPKLPTSKKGPSAFRDVPGSTLAKKLNKKGRVG